MLVGSLGAASLFILIGVLIVLIGKARVEREVVIFTVETDSLGIARMVEPEVKSGVGLALEGESWLIGRSLVERPSGLCRVAVFRQRDGGLEAMLIPPGDLPGYT